MGAWVLESQRHSMQGLPVDAQQQLSGSGSPVGLDAVDADAAAIDGITKHRVPHMLGMHPDLMGASCLQAEFDLRQQSAEFFHRFVVCHRPASAAEGDGHLQTVLAVAVEGGIDHTLLGHRSPEQRRIAAFHRVCLQLCRQMPVGVIILGDHQQTRRVPVETVDDPGTQDTIDA